MVAIEFSRPAAVAKALGTTDYQRFLKQKVLLRGELHILSEPNGYDAFRASFLLLIRICERVTVDIPEEMSELRRDIAILAAGLIPDRQIWPTGAIDLREYDAILSIGAESDVSLPWTTINSEGWLARVSSCGEALSASVKQSNAVGAIGAACLGVGEVFKRLIKLKPERGELLRATSFSFWSYRGDDTESGPALDPFRIDLLLIGCGAIGSGIAYALSRLPISGRMFALDRQTFHRENFGTSIIVGESSYGVAKAEVVANLLKPLLDARPLVTDIESYQSQYDANFPDVILSGLDDVQPRHEVQDLWPTLIIDGAVGGELSCQVSCHPWESSCGCLRCVFKTPEARDLAKLNADATGLPIDLANDPDLVVTEELIAKATPKKQGWLRTHLGKTVCSITSEAALKYLSDEKHCDGFAPAVPFVSCFSGCLCVAELVRYTMTNNVLPQPRFQFNFGWGPRRGVHFEEDRDPTCSCVTRRGNINKIRAARASRH